LFKQRLDGLGFGMKNKGVVDGDVRWCWLELGGAALMLSGFSKPLKVGEGMSLCAFRPKVPGRSTPNLGLGGSKRRSRRSAMPRG
jgi:hypothetical protein